MRAKKPLAAPRIFRGVCHGLVAAFLLAGGSGSFAGIYDEWAHSRKITFQGYDKTETLTNFPVLVILSNDAATGFAYADCLSTNGGDLRFSDSTRETALNYEIEKWDTNGMSFVWVQAPVITGTGDSIYVYWGYTNSTPSGTTAWNSNYIGVWHMAQTNALDSTTNARHGQAYSNINAFAEGAVDGANSFATGYVQVADSPAFTLSGAYTISAWVNAQTSSTHMSIAGTYNTAGFIFALTNTTRTLATWAGGTWVSSRYYIPTNVWKHVAYTRNGTAGAFYVDGVAVSNLTTATAGTDGGVLQIGVGGTSWPAQRFLGQIDEVRFSSASRSSNWLWTCWMNMASNTPFLSYGTTEYQATNLTVISLPPTSIMAWPVTFNGRIICTNSDPNTTIYFCWDTSDKGTAATSSWAHVIPAATTTGRWQSFSTNVTGLVAGQAYAYRCFATNTAGSAWSADAQIFTTPAYRMAVSFSAYNRSETLTNFPLLVTLGTNLYGFAYSQFTDSANGGDLRFTTPDGITNLNYEIEKWDTNGTSFIWVQVPAISGPSDFIYAFWGGTNIVSPPCITNGLTWDTNSYVGVWHMAQTNALDSTTNARHGQAYGAVALADDGKADGACEFNGSSDYIQTTAAKCPDATLGGTYTVSAWIKSDPALGRYENIAGTYSGGAVGFIFALDSSPSNRPAFWANSVWNYGQEPVPDGEWSHVAYTRSAAAGAQFYVNGNPVTTSGAGGAIGNSGYALSLGARTDLASKFDGRIDEIEMHKTVRSSNWIWACWANLAGTESFPQYSPPEPSNLTVQALAAAVTVTNSATFNGRIIGIAQGENPQTFFCWDSQDRGTGTTADWAHVESMGTNWGAGQFFSTNIAGLLMGSNYSYRCFATNAMGWTWSPEAIVFSIPALPRDWKYRMKIAFANYDKGETLTNFPLLVVFSNNVANSGFAYNQFLSGSNDLKFAASNETDELNYEIDKWNTNGASYVWVQVPQIADTNTFIYAYWGYTTNAPPSGATNGSTWSNGFKAVWHLGQNETRLDSTTNTYHGTPQVNVTATEEGQVGDADIFSGTGSGYGADGAISNGNVSVTRDQTIEFWIYAHNTFNKGIRQNLITKAYGGEGSITVETNPAPAGAYVNYYWGVSGNDSSPYQIISSGSIAAAFPSNIWTHLALVRDLTSASRTVRWYLNGVLMTNIAAFAGMANTSNMPLYLGKGWVNPFQGRLDEVRVSVTTRSSNWIWACWANQGSNSAFNLYNQCSGPLTVQALPATATNPHSATLNGMLCAFPAGSDNPDAYFCWGYTNAGTAGTGDWAHVESIGTNIAIGQIFSTNITGLLQGSNYSYRCFVTNATGWTWSPEVINFQTMYRPGVTNLGADVTRQTAALKGQITDWGLDLPSAWFQWWPIAGTPTSTVAMDLQSGFFSAGVTGLTPGASYAYWVVASNAAGATTSTVANFTTLTGPMALYVATNGSGLGGANWATALTDVQEAIDLSTNNDTIYLAGQAFGIATAVGWSTRSNMLIRGGFAATDNLDLPGSNNPALWPSTIQRASGTIRIMAINGVTNSRLEGVTIAGGDYANSPNGGGGLYIGNSRLTLDACTVRNNTTANSAYNDQYGGGILCNLSTVTFTNCVIKNNLYNAGQYTTVYGGGLCLLNSAVTLVHSVVATNKAYIFRWGYADYGGGIAVMGASTLFARNSLIVGNDSYSGEPGNVSSAGDGIYVNSGTALVENCTIAYNGGEGIRRGGGSVFVTNSIVWGNGDDITGAVRLAYCDVQTTNDLSWTNGYDGCFSADPLFADQTYFHELSRAGYYTDGYFSGGDWSTNSTVTNNPAIDAGDPERAWSLEPQPSGHRINLGAYGNTPVATKTFLEEPAVFTNLTVVSYPAVLVGTNYATIRGEVVHDGDAGNPEAYFCWSAVSDAGTTHTGNWPNVVAMGPQAMWQLFSNKLTGISGTNYFRCFTTNGAGWDWSASQVFGVSYRPSITNLEAEPVFRRRAALRGAVTDIGNDMPWVWIHFWTNGSPVTITNALGLTGGSFADTMAGLEAGTEYRYHVIASNSAGIVTSLVSSFTTIPAPIAWYVATNGSGQVGTNWSQAFPTIGAALTIAENNDTIYLAGHSFGQSVALSWVARSNMTIRGGFAAADDTDPPGINNPEMYPTVIRRASGTIRIMSVSALTNCTLEGVTITGGNIAASPNQGAGMYIVNSSLTLASCTVSNNTAGNAAYNDQYGGGLLIQGGAVTISNCLIRKNSTINGNFTSAFGGGICLNGGVCAVIRSVISQNTASHTSYASYGGGLAVIAGSCIIRNTLFDRNNSGTYGDGICLGGSGYYGTYYGTAVVVNCTLVTNSGEGLRLINGAGAATNSIFWGNGDDITGAVRLAYCDVQTVDSSWTNGVDGCISADPLFVDTNYFHEQSQGGHYTNGYFSGGGWDKSTNQSPCIDAGDLNSAWSEEPMPNGGRINMGAYGNTSAASMDNGLPGGIFIFY